jgi:hypothetical protein
MKTTNEGNNMEMTTGKTQIPADEVRIWMAPDTGRWTRKAAQEMTRYIGLQSGREPVAGSWNYAPQTGAAIMLGEACAFRELADSLALDRRELDALGAEDFILRNADVDGRPALLVVGGGDMAVLYGAYALLEAMGWVFRISGDVLPQKTPGGVIWPEINKTFSPHAAERGVMWNTFTPDHAVCGLEDYARLFDQMVKLRLTTFYWWHIPNMPWLDFTWRGEAPVLGDNGHPDSAFMLWRGAVDSFRTDDLPVGRERFKGWRIAPPEMQDCRTERECLEKGKWFASHVFDLAVERGLRVLFGFDPTAATANHARFLHGQPEGSFHGYSGARVPPFDPELAEFNRTRVEAILASYPQISGLVLNITESLLTFDSENDPRYQKLIHEAGPAWEAAIAAWDVEKPVFPNGRQVMLGALGKIHVIREIVDWCRERHPRMRLSTMSIGVASTAHLFDALLPSDVAHSDLEGSCVYVNQWKGHLALSSYGEVPRRRQMSIIPRSDDDAHMTGLNFHVRQFINDGMFGACAGIGMRGVMVQLNRPRGQEHNMAFLSENAWDPGLSEKAFYDRYCGRLFGGAAPLMRHAYDLLESENERTLRLLTHEDQRYTEPSWAKGIKSFVNQPRPVNGPFNPANQKAWDDFLGKARAHQSYRDGIATFDRAYALMAEALPLAPEGAGGEIRYLMNRITFYREWTRCLVDCQTFAEQFEAAFRLKQSGDYRAFAEHLTECRMLAEDMHRRQRKLVEEFNLIVDSPNDLGLLFSLNRLGLTVFEEFATMVRHIDDFHHGRAYWQHRPNWNRVNGGGEWCLPYGRPTDDTQAQEAQRQKETTSK